MPRLSFMLYTLPFILFFGGIIAIIIAVFSILKILYFVSNKSILLNKVKTGLVEISGIVKNNNQSLISPFSNEICVFYKCLVKYIKGNSTKTLFSFYESKVFSLYNDNSSILIDLKKTKLYKIKYNEYYLKDCDEKIRQKVFRIIKGKLTNKIDYATLYLEEYTIKEKDYLYIKGKVEIVKKNNDRILKNFNNKKLILSNLSRVEQLKILKRNLFINLIGGIIFIIISLIYFYFYKQFLINF